jgi:membrane-bound lytic murein transglycosylase B
LDETLQQLVQKKEGYGESKEAQRTQTEELRHKAGLEDSAGRLSMSKERMEVRIAQLRAEARAGLLKRPPASRSGSVGAAMRERELEIARNDIVARPVEPIPYERYVQIYKASAKRYGFAKDWYVLAAVGKVESNHGENMGPSSAGAMGPMQFLPSTWKEYGVDGNRDGVANIMDPEDATPAAAAYLKVGGAPKDWYAALYTYNRAGWYVREVLSVAESYRRLAKDDEAEPYG